MEGSLLYYFVRISYRLRSSAIKPLIIVGVVCVRYVILPAVGIWIVKAAGNLGFLPPDPLFHYVLMIQFTVPPAMNIGTMTQLFDVGQEECSVLFLWTYLAAALALTTWSTVFMWILT
ncbi:Membrane transport protein - like 2 [Theobroma cacao]|nr:Membrane transport protein - like 2 [Theobroma cacao]